MSFFVVWSFQGSVASYFAWEADAVSHIFLLEYGDLCGRYAAPVLPYLVMVLGDSLGQSARIGGTDDRSISQVYLTRILPDYYSCGFFNKI